jgi:hypothetical protein
MTPQPRSHQARSALLWGLASFVALQLGLTLGMESWLRVLRDPYYGFKFARLQRRAHEVHAAGGTVVVMVGSSRVYDGLRGSLAETALAGELGRPVALFNFGIPGDGPLHELLNVERLLADGVRPDLLLVEVLPSYLGAEAEIQFNIAPAERLGLRDRTWLRHVGVSARRFKRYNWTCWALPWYAHRYEMISVLLPRFLPRFLRQDWARRCDEAGWAPPVYDLSPEARRRALDVALGGYGHDLGHFRLGNSFSPALRRLLERCREEAIPSALLLMPESPLFHRVYGPGAFEQVEGFLNGLAEEQGVPVITARDWVLDEECYLDGHHLLPDGAAIFTTRLARDAVLPLLRDDR